MLMLNSFFFHLSSWRQYFFNEQMFNNEIGFRIRMDDFCKSGSIEL